MDYILDTNAISDLMREDPNVTARCARVQAPDRNVICPIVRGEIMYGLQRMPEGRRRRNLTEKAQNLFPSMAAESVPMSAGDHYAAIKLSCELRGLSVDENDLWIAATALARGATVVTRDSDFRRLDGLLVEDWSK